MAPLSLSWQSPPRMDRAALARARRQTHWAVQILAAAGATLVPPRPDDSHTNLGWLPSSGAFTSHRVSSPRTFSVALRLRDLSLAFLPEEGMESSLSLNGHTLDEAMEWLEGLIGGPPRLARPVYDLPVTPLSQGVHPFELDLEGMDALACWFGNAQFLLAPVQAEAQNASPVRCWPHHFDMATLVKLDAESADPETARSIGVGFSPGDGSYDEPYFYVSPWPRPGEASPPLLEGGGAWHQEGWFGAVLTASRLEGGDADQAQAFLRSGLRACRDMLSR